SPTVLVGEALLRVAYLQRPLLRAARNVYGPTGVAEVPSHLTEDRGYCERREGVTALRVEPIECLEQSERGDLQQILERLRGVAIAPRQATRKGHEPLQQRLSCGAIATPLPARKQLMWLVRAAEAVKPGRARRN